MAHRTELTDTHRALWHAFTMCPLRYVPGTSSAPPHFGPNAFTARQSHVTEPQPSAQHFMSKKRTDTGPPCHVQQRFLCWEMSYALAPAHAAISRRYEKNKVDACATRARTPRAFPPRAGQRARSAHRRLSGVPGHGGPEESAARPRLHPAAPREEPLTWRVISDLIFCMMAPPPPRVRSAAAQGAGSRRSHVGRHLTAPARGSLGAVVPARPLHYKSRQRGRQGGPWSCGLGCVGVRVWG